MSQDFPKNNLMLSVPHWKVTILKALTSFRSVLLGSEVDRDNKITPECTDGMQPLIIGLNWILSGIHPRYLQETFRPICFCSDMIVDCPLGTTQNQFLLYLSLCSSLRVQYFTRANQSGRNHNHFLDIIVFPCHKVFHMGRQLSGIFILPGDRLLILCQF